MAHDEIAADSAIRTTGVIGLAAIALIHLLDFDSKWHETRYLAFGYLILIAASLVAGALLLGGRHRTGWLLAAGCAFAPLISYILSRTSGLPSASDDVGNWLESLGLASLFVEGCVALLAGFALGVITGPAQRLLNQTAAQPAAMG